MKKIEDKRGRGERIWEGLGLGLGRMVEENDRAERWGKGWGLKMLTGC